MNHSNKSEEPKKNIFCFLEILIDSMYAKMTTQLKVAFGFRFLKSRNPRENQIRNIFSVKTKHYLQSLVFFVFGVPSETKEKFAF